MECKKICKIFASELGSKSGVMRGFQKCITLGGRASGSARKVMGGWGVAQAVIWWGSLFNYSVISSPVLESGVWIWDFGL